MSREDSAARFRRQVSPLVRRLRASPAGPAADRAMHAHLDSVIDTLRQWQGLD